MSDAKDEAEVTRLLDMVVEEVSLVDRAANKHRFLIVKRGEAMATKARGKTKAPKDEQDLTDEEAASAADEAAPPPKKPKRPFPPKEKAKSPKGADDGEDPAPDDGDGSADEGDPPPRRGRRRGAKKEAPDPMSALGLTLATLDKLATAVEELEDDEEDDEAFVELARDLRKASDAIAKAVGADVDAEDGAAEEATEEEEGEEPAPAPKVGGTAAVLTAVRDMLARLEGALAPAAPERSAPAPETGSGATEVGKQFRQIATAVKAIDTSVRAQSARLTGLEKRTGLPNSQPPEASSRRRNEVSWPLDINRRMDRDHVAKELSFHDDD